MYHQFDRTLHPRQSVLSIIMNMNEQSKQLEEDIKDLEAVSILSCLIKHICLIYHVTVSSILGFLITDEENLLGISFLFVENKLPNFAHFSLGLFVFFFFFNVKVP
jgi:hypothetical protein